MFTLVDYHGLKNSQKKSLDEQALKHGLFSYENGFRLEWFDDESNTHQFTLFKTRAEAEENAPDYEPNFKIIDELLYSAAPKLIEYWHSRHGGTEIDYLSTREAAHIWLFDHHTEFDGVFFNDTLDPMNLSAPRAGLFQRTLQNVKKVPIP